MITPEWPTSENPYAVPFIVRQVEQLRRAGIEVDVFYFRGAKNPMKYLYNWRLLRKKIAREHYDLIHAQWGQSALLALPKKVPLVITYRGSDLDGMLDKRGKQSLAGRILQLVSTLVSLQADEIIVVSDHLANKLPKRSYQVIPSGLDLDMFRPMDKTEARRILSLPKNNMIALFVGDPAIIDKGFELASAATELIKHDFPDLCLLLAHGIPYKQMPLFLNSSDVLVLSSAHEGSPNVVKEALACNLPVVSTDVGDVYERIGAIDGCVVCKSDEPETLARALEKVLSCGQRIDGRQTVMDLDERLLTQKVIRVYQTAIKRNKFL